MLNLMIKVPHVLRKIIVEYHKMLPNLNLLNLNYSRMINKSRVQKLKNLQTEFPKIINTPKELLLKIYY